METQAQSSLSCCLCLAVLDKAGDTVVTKTAPSPALRGSRTVHQSADQCQSWEGVGTGGGLKSRMGSPLLIRNTWFVVSLNLFAGHWRHNSDPVRSSLQISLNLLPG